MNPGDLVMLRGLSEQQKHYTLTLYASREKKTSTAYILWLLFGCHYFYLGKIGMNLLLWALYFIVIGAIWWFIDLFRISGMVRQKNHDILMQCMQEALSLYPSGNTNTGSPQSPSPSTIQSCP
ncbi:MAG: TM2 domain-containing protein [Dialister sp.]|nr:TM2 domain-containing protein [Dialister sp.]